MATDALPLKSFLSARVLDEEHQVRKQHEPLEVTITPVVTSKTDLFLNVLQM